MHPFYEANNSIFTTLKVYGSELHSLFHRYVDEGIEMKEFRKGNSI